MLRGLVFDFNGVLVDDEPLHLALLGRVLGEEGIELAPGDDLRRFLGRDDRACFAAALAEAGRAADAGVLGRLIARKASYYQREVHRAGYAFFPGAVELVRAAAGEGLLLGLVTGALRDEVDGALRQVGLERAFAALVTAEDVAAGKPDPEGYRRAIDGMNSRPPLPARLVHPHEVAAIEDSPAGLAAAAAAGLRTVAVAHSRPAAELEGAELVTPAVAALTLAELRARFAGL